MSKKICGFLLIVTIILLAACQPTPTPVPTPTAILITVTPLNTQVPTMALPTITSVPLATATSDLIPTATMTPSMSTLPDYSSTSYLDDRSTPAALMLSFANAINLHQYIRAYSYWIDPATYLGTLDNFSNSYSNVTSVEVVFGQISAEGAAGSVYYTVPLIFKNTNTSSTVDKLAACYILRMPQPGNYGAPPITPMHIDRGTTQLLSASTSDSDGLAVACSGPDYSNGGLPSSPASVENVNDLSKSNYIDNRSGAVEVVSSLLNSLNRKEYVRAYSYWQNPSTTVGSYASYAAGYSDTETVTATFGTVVSDAGAGQYHYQVPLAMIVLTTSSSTQTFVGCYTLHLANPGMQATPPFEPLGITKGHFTQVANGTNTAPLLATACN